MLLTERRADRVVLHNIGWQKFESLLVDLGENRAAKIAYDDGTLEIMTPLPEHEYYKEIIGDIIKDTAEILEIDYECYGSATWKQELKKAGIESDNCFYFQNEALIRGKLKFDLNQDPPPDLALEIDVTSKSLDRFSIYARLGVPEIWCYDTGEIKIYQLQGEEYIQTKTSLVFPHLNILEIPSLIEKYRMAGKRVFRQAIREWVRGQIREQEK
ncbi:Uma2 family endonuclease [Nostoc sp. FACHB-87]|uniref:Uma2 family endonuclease n=1 Tax=Nostocales TaxID=1161 RepID=UPI001683F3F3|nr:MULTISPECIES: Uma2 family endonuclease [Nostocales]MBD2456641.1 Uma2 family endonuclease [Nostoc sp. FACHB-87]MBD2477990.1 Uma2 family endonuclease [Anabaena sp. FACHB-83]MBD2489896.1 Uma2 family endonuclease [Aulosira sp. FACHB-615]